MMKKLIAVVLMLAVVLCTVSASAELSYYYLVGAVDAEGNMIALPDTVQVFAIENETEEDGTLICAFGLDTETIINGVAAIAEQDEESVTLAVALEDGTALEMKLDIRLEVDGTDEVTSRRHDNASAAVRRAGIDRTLNPRAVRREPDARDQRQDRSEN